MKYHQLVSDYKSMFFNAGKKIWSVKIKYLHPICFQSSSEDKCIKGRDTKDGFYTK